MAEFPFYEPEKVLRRNLATNPSFENGTGQPGFFTKADAGAIVTTDTAWSSAGSRSLKTTGAGYNTSAYWVGDQTRPSLAPGKTYTVAVTVHLEGAQSGELDIYARGLNVCAVAGDGSVEWWFSSTVAANVAGSTRLVNTVTIPANYQGAFIRLMNGSTSSDVWWDAFDIAEASTARPYFDGDTEPTGDKHYRYASDGTSEEYALERNTNQLSGATDISASTNARLGIVSDIYSRSREKIQLKLAGVDDLVRAGHRIELAAAAMTSTPAVWHWRQVTGPTVALNVKGNTCDFIAPDVEKTTRVRIGVYAASEDGANRSDWRYFDLNVEPPMLRFRGEDDGDFSPRSPYLVGYSRGKREIWNDVIRPTTYEKNPRHEPKKLDLGIPDDDVVFSTTMPKRMAAGGVWVNPETGDVFRNFGAGYNETDDTTASPRTSTYWVNPANGDILEWIED